MRIGIDFDNTLVRYDEVFALESKNSGLMPEGWEGSKQELRDELRSSPEGVKLWQILQGRVYGPLMNEAKIFPGVASFLMRIRNRGDEIFIVSHRTEYGHYDRTRTPLRKAALDWMEKKGFFDSNRFGLSKNQVYFSGTRAEKVVKIADLNCDAFIDDLEEVFAEKHFPPIRKVLFNSKAKGKHHDLHCRNWTEITESLLGKLEESECQQLLESFFAEKLASVHQLQGQGNSRVYKVETGRGKTYALKAYADLLLDPRLRLQTEVKASKFLEPLKLTPCVKTYDEDLNLALFEWIEGEVPSLINSEHIECALEFVYRLKKLPEVSGLEFHQASEACLSLKQLESQIENRFVELIEIESPDLKRFLITTLKPLWLKTREFSRSIWPAFSIDNELPRSLQTLSPSDFGFHNSIQKDDGSLFFLDLEYFGWDDPVKLIADFIWHPGMNLKDAHKKKWVKKALEIFKKDTEIKTRFLTAWPLYGIRWILIILSEFGEDGWKKRSRARLVDEIKREQILKKQLKKAENISTFLRDQNLDCPYV